MIVITVGTLKNSTITAIDSIVNSSANGLRIQARDTDSIREAFNQAIDIINKGQVNLETL